MVHRALFVLTLLQVGSVQDACHCEAKVGSKGVNGHGATCILNLQPWENRGLLLESPLIMQLRSGLHHAHLVCPLIFPACTQSWGEVDKNALVLLSILLAWSHAWPWHFS